MPPPFGAADHAQPPHTRFRHVSGNTRDAEADDCVPSRASVRPGSPATAACPGTSSAPVDRPQSCAPLSCMDTSSEGRATALNKCRSGRSGDRATAGACSSSLASVRSVAAETIAPSRKQLSRRGPPVPAESAARSASRAAVQNRYKWPCPGDLRAELPSPGPRGRPWTALSTTCLSRSRRRR